MNKALPVENLTVTNEKSSLFSILFNPGSIVAERLSSVSWIFSLTVSGLSFTLFFLQTGLDRMRTGSLAPAGVMLAGVKGLFLGTVGIFILSLVAFVQVKISGGSWKVGQTVRAVALSYASALVYMTLGLLANIFLSWNTSIAFGITGVIWAMGPLYSVFRSMVSGRTLPAVIITTACGFITLYGWYMFAAV